MNYEFLLQVKSKDMFWYLPYGNILSNVPKLILAITLRSEMLIFKDTANTIGRTDKRTNAFDGEIARKRRPRVRKTQFSRLFFLLKRLLGVEILVACRTLKE